MVKAGPQRVIEPPGPKENRTTHENEPLDTWDWEMKPVEDTEDAPVEDTKDAPVEEQLLRLEEGPEKVDLEVTVEDEEISIREDEEVSISLQVNAAASKSLAQEEERRKSVQRAKRAREIKVAKTKAESGIDTLTHPPSPRGLTKKEKLRAMAYGKPA